MHYRNWILIGVLLFSLLCAAPAAAITVKHLDVTVAENGDADITADYTLNWMEQAIVYPAIFSILKTNPPANTVIHSISNDQVSLTVKDLVKVRHTKDTTVYTTPSFSAEDAQKELDRFWFANMVTLDFTSATITLSFPDGATAEYTDLLSVPSFVYTMRNP